MRLSAGLVALAIVLGGAPAQAWRAAITGTPPNGRPSAVAVDADGTVIAVGGTPNLAADEDALAVALAGGTGVQLWQHQVAGAAALDDLYRGVAARDGIVVGVGRVSVPQHEGDALITRFGPDGSPVWEIQLDGPANLEEDALAVTIDSAGGVFVAGSSTTPTARPARSSRYGSGSARTAASSGPPSSRRMPSTPSGAPWRRPAATRSRRAASGRTSPSRDSTAAQAVVVWQKVLAGSATVSAVARSVAVGNGRVAVGGQLPNPAGDSDFAVVAFDAVTGTELWRTVIDGTLTGDNDQDDVTGVAIDAAGDVLAVGRLSNTETDDDAVAVKLAGATGAELWRTVVNGPNNNDESSRVWRSTAPATCW